MLLCKFSSDESKITSLPAVWRWFDCVVTSGAAATEHVEKYFENEKDELLVNLSECRRAGHRRLTSRLPVTCCSSLQRSSLRAPPSTSATAHPGSGYCINSAAN